MPEPNQQTKLNDCVFPSQQLILVFIFDVLRVAKMEFENNVWVNMLKSAHKTSLLQDGMLAALFYSPVDSPMHQTCIRVMHV